MASVKASVYRPPVTEDETVFPDVVVPEVSYDIKNVIYILMLITILLFIRKLVVTFCRRRCGRLTSAKDE